MSIDIEYLLLLQRFRENIHDGLTPFMEWISLFAVTYLIMIPVFVYWAIDKEKGLYTLVSYYLCCGVNAMVKLTACVNRPWIKDQRVIPAGDAITTATGYSFPSGHTTTAGPIYGALAVASWSWKKIISIFLILLILITGFSRNYLGVHTPQDVLMGLFEAFLAVYLAKKLFTYLKKHPEKENIFLIISFVIGWLGIAYITFKPYPMDYKNGKLLVDPQKMMNDGYGDTCLLIVYPIARYIEKKWIKFKSTGIKNFRVLISLIGLIPLFMMIRWMKAPLDKLMGSHWGHFCYSFIVVLYCVALYPLIIKLTTSKNNTSSDTKMTNCEENITVTSIQDSVALTIKSPQEIV
ncbi:acid phosphatase/Vanadium-dependent haloperoxidase [Anaeromyces robustus]|uniref:Acid phosphatase/Vanadium-dependent haloperoxidase n=1 Tax=Anaeromyces robustus TaxID=1754192 RepID=A0A1Y1X407_9FUNG|nr:acid phosphatase/Vanadium-dependent haloperoxidase [Anaeromyces robustus]|eukprot:ORX80368.1 acid phosphatase/Vanadium-dependent haloperoxidase [Anaeromyces robustus]